MNAPAILWAFAAALGAGLPIAVAIIHFGRRYKWFPDAHFIGKREFERRLEEAFQGRNALDDESFFTRYFAKRQIPKDIPVRIRRIFQEHLKADFSRISAEDDLSKELNFPWNYDSLADVEIVQALEKEFGVCFSDTEAAEAKTLLRIAELINQKIHS
ncbi:MAG: acyl carrier protein [Verrucomicrobiae bacterium]|nr:acyl carrier protein [Verrucomicrobiae bacterium]